MTLLKRQCHKKNVSFKPLQSFLRPKQWTIDRFYLSFIKILKFFLKFKFSPCYQFYHKPRTKYKFNMRSAPAIPTAICGLSPLNVLYLQQYAVCPRYTYSNMRSVPTICTVQYCTYSKMRPVPAIPTAICGLPVSQPSAQSWYPQSFLKLQASSKLGAWPLANWEFVKPA